MQQKAYVISIESLFQLAYRTVQIYRLYIVYHEDTQIPLEHASTDTGKQHSD